MMKYLLPLTLLLLMTASMFASQTYVLAEVFSTTTCGYCPSARSALNQMNQNEAQFPNLIPLIWQGNGTHASAGYSSRRSLYGFTGIPHGRFCGNIVQGGGGAGVYNAYVNCYNQGAGRNAPMEMSIRLSINAQNELVINADVSMTGDISTTANNIVFVVAYDLTGTMDPDYFASVKAYANKSFPLTSTGQEQLFTHSFPLDASWDLEKLTAVVFVQSFDNSNPIVHQACQRAFDGISAAFSSNVRQGPPSLHVNFENLSMSSGNEMSYFWDLDGDGNIDSFEENPTFIYNEPGTYDVKLTISDGIDEDILMMEKYITVLEPDNVYGTISGIFSKEYAPYKIVGDVTVPADGFLEIEPGLEIEIENASIHIKGDFSADALDDEQIIFTSNSTWKGIHLDKCEEEVKITNCVFSKATETALKISNSKTEIIGNVFHHNEATGANAAAVKILSSNKTTFRNNVFANNRSALGSGAIEVEASSFNISNNLFVNNSGQVAAAIFIKLGTSTDIINNTIVNNTYDAANGFHILNSSSYVQIRNSIIKGEGTIFSTLTGAITLAEYSNISGGWEGLDVIDEDPMFEEPSEGNGADYDGLNAVWILQDDSPCIDAGNPSASFNDPEDPDNPGYARFPAKGTIRNDLGVYGGSRTDFWVSVEDDYLVVRPETRHLIKAYPNPFNPEVHISLDNISFDNHKPSSLKVYNTKGQLVKTILDNEIMENREFLWTGLDNNNQPSSSGVYLIHFTSDRMTTSKRIILLK